MHDVMSLPPSRATVVYALPDGRPCLVTTKSAAARGLLKQICTAGRSNANVLVTGETGTGKEIVARLVHHVSRRAGGPFVAQNCAAIPHDLLESELFGMRRGAFTGAVHDRKGLFEEAANGTLLLDEVSEVLVTTQAKLLRAVEDKEIRPVGSTKSIRAETRLIAASNGDLMARIRHGSFRADLYYRLSALHIHVPPLRERREDIADLVDHFVQRHAGTSIRVTDEALQVMIRHQWPGNVRQLENVVRAALATAEGDSITIGDLPPTLSAETPARATATTWPIGADLRRRIDDQQREKLISALLDAGGNKARAARTLGLSRAGLYYNLRKHNLA